MPEVCPAARVGCVDAGAKRRALGLRSVLYMPETIPTEAPFLGPPCQYQVKKEQAR